MSLTFDKRSMRATLLQMREALGPLDYERQGCAAQTLLLECPAFQTARTLALYSPIRNEIRTDRLLAAAISAGKKVCFPRVEGDELLFFCIESPSDLRAGCFGINEPDNQLEEVTPEQLDLVVIPGVAFDLQGHRLGYGGGFFDRFLATGRFKGLRIGLGFDFQIVDRLPIEMHDQQVDLLVTEKNIISPSS